MFKPKLEYMESYFLHKLLISKKNGELKVSSQNVLGPIKPHIASPTKMV